MQIDANDDNSCWIVICRKPYKDKLEKGVKAMVHEYWLKNYRVSPYMRDVL